MIEEPSLARLMAHISNNAIYFCNLVWCSANLFNNEVVFILNKWSQLKKRNMMTAFWRLKVLTSIAGDVSGYSETFEEPSFPLQGTLTDIKNESFPYEFTAWDVRIRTTVLYHSGAPCMYVIEHQYHFGRYVSKRRSRQSTATYEYLCAWRMGNHFYYKIRYTKQSTCSASLICTSLFVVYENSTIRQLVPAVRLHSCLWIPLSRSLNKLFYAKRLKRNKKKKRRRGRRRNRNGGVEFLASCALCLRLHLLRYLLQLRWVVSFSVAPAVTHKQIPKQHQQSYTTVILLWCEIRDRGSHISNRTSLELTVRSVTKHS
jgi:hypothetical protein